MQIVLRSFVKRYVLLSLFLCLLTDGFSQQNFINVPSSEITPKNKLFFQQQLNINELIQSNTTLDYGLGRNFEVGINILGLNYSSKMASFLQNDSLDRDPYNPLVLINGLKKIELYPNTSVSLGGQLGLNFFDKLISPQKAFLTYLNLSFDDKFIPNSRFVLGGYYNSLHYGGEGSRLSFWLAAEVPLNNKVHLMSESIIGSNALSYTSLGVIYFLTKKMPITFGIQLPNVQANAAALVIEFTIIP